MSKADTIHSWKNPAARAEADTQHPAGSSQLTDDELSNISGGTGNPGSLDCPTSPFSIFPWCQLK